MDLQTKDKKIKIDFFNDTIPCQIPHHHPIVSPIFSKDKMHTIWYDFLTENECNHIIEKFDAQKSKVLIELPKECFVLITTEF